MQTGAAGARAMTFPRADSPNGKKNKNTAKKLKIKLCSLSPWQYYTFCLHYQNHDLDPGMQIPKKRGPLGLCAHLFTACSPCSCLVRGTEVSAVAPPDIRTASFLS